MGIWRRKENVEKRTEESDIHNSWNCGDVETKVQSFDDKVRNENENIIIDFAGCHTHYVKTYFHKIFDT